MTTILVILLLLVFISGAPLYTIMLAATALGALVFRGKGFDAIFDGAIVKMFGTSGRDEMETLSTIPLFIYAGYVLAEAKTADRLVRFANAMLGWLPGGLAIVTILTCSLFTVFTGASGVTIIALGGVLMPALVRNGYPEKFSMGLIAGTGSVGLLFPPALPLFIYGTVYGLNQSDAEREANVWTTERFLFAGIVPGIVLVGMLAMVAVTVAVYRGLPRQKFKLRELGVSFVVALPELFIPFGVILGMASGFALPEVAALTVVYVTLLEVVIYRMINMKALWSISYEALAMIGAIFLLILASTALTDYVVYARIPQKLVEWTQSTVESKVVFLLAINLILLIVGTVMDIFSAIVVVLPLIAPIARAYGIDPYHLGVIFLLNLEVGYLHPPVGLNLFLTSVKFQRPITEVMWATVPFLITMIVALLVITYVPSLTVVPPPKRNDRVVNLLEITRQGIAETQVPFAEVKLVDRSGNPLQAKGKPIVKKFLDCTPKSNPVGADGKPAVSKEVIERCTSLFTDMNDCKIPKPRPKTLSTEQQTCVNDIIAKWTAEKYNTDTKTVDPIILVDKLEMVDEKGEALLADDDAAKKLVDKNGKPLVRTFAWCSELKYDADKATCRSLFIAASGCIINPDAKNECPAQCEQAPPAGAPPAPGPGSADGSAGSGSAAGSAGSASAGSAGSGSASAGSAGSAEAGSAGSASAAPPAADCKKTCWAAKTKACTLEAVKNFTLDSASVAFNPPVGQKSAEEIAAVAGAEDQQGCSAAGSGAAGGLLFAGAGIVFALRRRRYYLR